MNDLNGRTSHGRFGWVIDESAIAWYAAGVRHFIFHDPDGNRLEACQVLHHEGGE